MSTSLAPTLLAVVVVRNGVAPAGADEATAEANGNVLVVGTDTSGAAATLKSATNVTLADLGPDFAPMATIGRAICKLAIVRSAHGLVLPASPDGRDLAPLLAHVLRRPLLAAAMTVSAERVTCVRTAGRIGREHATPAPFVATLIPGLRGVSTDESASAQSTETKTVEPPFAARAPHPDRPTVTSRSVVPPDPATMDLTEARCIVGGGLGLRSKDRFDQLGRIGELIGASLGGTRVASDAGWIPFERQIGTTGVAVKPKVYVAFGISGATQHTSGLGDPDHIISVNTDASCPMMTMSDLAIVSDAHAVLDALETKLAGR